MLDDECIEYRYREYTKEPLSEKELTALFQKLGESPRALLRKRDAAYAEASITDKTTDAQLIKKMAKHPTLLQRPIGVKGKKAVVGRPVERLLEL